MVTKPFWIKEKDFYVNIPVSVGKILCDQNTYAIKEKISTYPDMR